MSKVIDGYSITVWTFRLSLMFANHSYVDDLGLQHNESIS